MLTGSALPQTLDSLKPDSGSQFHFERVQHLADSITAPLPQGSIPEALRWVFNLSTTVQIAAAATGIIIALVLVLLLWKRRELLLGWFRTRWGQAGWRVGFITIGGIALAAAAGGGYAANRYMEHANDFCVSCHVMNTAFVKFQSSEHVKLQCHDCHKTTRLGQLKELYVWVFQKPNEIPKHAPVPNDICEKCHVQKDPQKTWQRISATAGHRIHLTSDSASLRNVQCTKCHGAEVHHFVPAAKTCGQAQCHEKLEVKMGKMANVAVHCAGCHQFTAPVAENISRDSTHNFLVPRGAQCLACHEMRSKLAGFEAEKDPHKGTCGSCHNPHTQDMPDDAFKSCTTGGCHARPDTISAFHKGIAPAQLAECKSCHQAHTWTVKGDQCISCHKTIDENDKGRPAGAAPHGRTASAAPADTVPFRHVRHRDVQCTSCHSSKTKHGAVMVKTMTDCQSCHHQPVTVAKGRDACQQCHRGALARRIPVQQAFAVSARPAGKPTPTRPLTFTHQQHGTVQCQQCHSTPITLAVTKTCTSCHQDHHQVERNCRSCHSTPSPRTVHQRTAHLGCAGSGCHTDQAAINLPARRNVCLACHQTMVTHKPNRECAQCHQVNWNPTARRVAEQ
ncbi:MAG: NapC/NirT family cytochrome c [Gemmatimonadaceae bacterium]